MSKEGDVEITNNLHSVHSTQEGTNEPIQHGEYKRTISNTQLHVSDCSAGLLGGDHSAFCFISRVKPPFGFLYLLRSSVGYFIGIEHREWSLHCNRKGHR